MSWAALFATLILTMPAALHPSRPALTLCNRTSYILYAATAEQDATSVVTRGWQHIYPGDCVTPPISMKDATGLFAYARSSDTHAGPRRAWGGSQPFCVADKSFDLRSPAGAAECSTKGTHAVAFAAIDAGNAQDRMLTFSDSPAFPSAEAARNAGVNRLLHDIGYDTGKNRDSALAQFRTRSNLLKTATADRLFAALEKQARATVQPAGYSICNDGGKEVWAALGLKTGDDFISRGWWDIPAGACTIAIATPLSKDPVYLFASRIGNNHIVSGSEAFCVANTVFDVLGRSHCAARKLIIAGFLPTNVAGLPGFVAHIGNDGIVFPHGLDKP